MVGASHTEPVPRYTLTSPSPLTARANECFGASLNGEVKVCRAQNGKVSIYLQGIILQFDDINFAHGNRGFQNNNTGAGQFRLKQTFSAQCSRRNCALGNCTDANAALCTVEHAVIYDDAFIGRKLQHKKVLKKKALRPAYRFPYIRAVPSAHR